MAFAAVLFLTLAPAPTQAGEPPFACTLPPGYAAFALAGADDWSAAAEGGAAAFRVRRHWLESPGARPELVARTLRDSLLGGAGARLQDLSVEEWSGAWGGVDGAAGHVLRFAIQGRPQALLERFAVLHDVLVQFTWEGPAQDLAAAAACADSFRIPDAWIPPPPPTADLHRGVAPGSAARDYPWLLRIELDLVAWTERGVVEVQLRADPVPGGPPPPPVADWLLPPGAQVLTAAEPLLRYRLDPRGEPAALAPWGLAVSSQSDLAGCDAAWLAAPDPGPGQWLPPSWDLTIRHPPHLILLGPQPPSPQLQADGSGSLSRFQLPAGRAWPFFLAGRFQKRAFAGTVWHLRLDAQARTPDEAVQALAKLQAALVSWLPAAAAPWSLASFPGAGDRALPGLLVLDESRGWFAEPADAHFGALPRRAWLARQVAAAVFGQRLRGSGSGAPVLESALAEYAAARLLEGAGWTKDAAALRDSWAAAEESAGPLTVPLTLLPASEAFGAGRLLSRGGRAWSALESLAGRSRLDGVLAAALAAGAPWSTQDLVGALPAETRDRAAAILYGTGPL